MILEYLECSVQLVFILFSLLFSLFKYIGSKKKGWFYSVGFFTSSLLSSFFWTLYLIIMGESPNASSFLTYLGWNIAFFILLLLNIHVKEKEERRYFNLLMLVPIPLNILQLKLYFQFGGILLSIYQVTICTVIACLSIQGILWYFKNRRNGAKKPYVAVVSLLNILAEFLMWTTTCFDGWPHDLYYPSSFLSSATYLLMLWAISKMYSRDTASVEGVIIDRRIQNIMKGSYAAIVVVCSLGGFILCSWIRGLLTEDIRADTENDVYAIISAVLFLISMILAAFAVAIVIIVYFEQRVSENTRLREEKKIADRANAAKSDFLANMSHEIRTPINAVLGMNKMISLECLRTKERFPADEQAVRGILSDIAGYAGNIESAGNNLLSIINDILDFSKIEAGKMTITEHEYMLSSLLNDVSNMVLFRARDKGLAFKTEVDETIPDRLYGDDVRLRQVIGNLLSNAVKYTDSGTVTLSVTAGQERGAGESMALTVSVKDTGIGIRREELEKIFDKFERTDLDRNSTVEGTGLGLAITHRLAAMMGGSIHVESEYGSRSVFSLSLPQRVVSAEPIGDFHTKFEKSVDSMHDTEKYFRAPDARILIVDDTRMNLTVAAGLLKDTGIQTDTAESGKEALNMALAKRYDLILMDQRMPVMDGTEALHRLREQTDGMNAQTPVICLTADALIGAKERYIAEGFSDYLSKPIDSRKLKQLLMEYLPEDKLLPASEDTPEENAAAGSAGGAYPALKRAGIDAVKGLRYCQDDTELYNIMLREYIKEAPKKREELEKYHISRAARDYAIVVHSLKSTSRTIGADSFSDIAAGLEKAADKEQWDYIDTEHNALLEAYEALVRAVTEAVGSEPESETGLPSSDDEILEFFPE